jgi:hypothetical protein
MSEETPLREWATAENAPLREWATAENAGYILDLSAQSRQPIAFSSMARHL